MPKTRDAVKILHRQIGDDPELRKMLVQARINADIAQLIYDARTAVGLTQQELADLVETTQLVISRLEDADYDGHSLSMLQRIGAALNQRLEIRFVPTNLTPETTSP